MDNDGTRSTIWHARRSPSITCNSRIDRVQVTVGRPHIQTPSCPRRRQSQCVTARGVLPQEVPSRREGIDITIIRSNVHRPVGSNHSSGFYTAARGVRPLQHPGIGQGVHMWSSEPKYGVPSDPIVGRDTICPPVANDHFNVPSGRIA